MKFIRALIGAVIFCALLLCQSVRADDYLLINMTSYTSAESHKAIEYAKTELKKGRPVIIFLNDASVMVAAKANSQQFLKQQQDLGDLIKKGAIVAACPHCLKRYKIDQADLLAGIQIAEVERESH